MYGQNPEMWRQLYWERDSDKECDLAAKVLPWYETIKIYYDEYELICEEGGNITDGGTFKKQMGTSGLPRIYLQRLEGYTLLDWSAIIENATIIHAVSSSSLYLFETLNLKAKEIHLYSRKAGQRDFDMIKPLMSKNYILHI
jgi:hypothetical protein